MKGIFFAQSSDCGFKRKKPGSNWQNMLVKKPKAAAFSVRHLREISRLDFDAEKK